MEERAETDRSDTKPASGASLAIVIPALNEYPGIIEVLGDVRRVADSMIVEGLFHSVEIVVVDDGSTDDTGLGAGRIDGVRVIRHEKNRGYGAALKTGFAAATSSYLSFLDADGTYPPTELPALCRAMLKENADLVIGSRLAGAHSDMPLVRYWGNLFFAKLTSWVSGTYVSDCASGMRVFPRTSLPRFYPLPDGLNFTPAMTTRALLEGLRILQIPMSYHERRGSSKLSAVRDGFRFLGSILQMTTLYNPLKFFGLIGLCLLLLGMIYGLEPLFHYISQREVPERYIYRLLAILTFWLAGLQIVTLGLLANVSLGLIHRQISRHNQLHTFIIRRRAWLRLDVIGIVLIVIAVSLNWHNLIEYFLTGAISNHWSYLLTGAVLSLSGIQVWTVHIMLGILMTLRQRDEEMSRDLTFSL